MSWLNPMAVYLAIADALTESGKSHVMGGDVERARDAVLALHSAEVGLLRLALELAQQLGRAYRGDWTDFDGRTLRNALDSLDAVAAGTETADQFRLMSGLCQAGQGHWADYCTEDTCGCEGRDR